MTDVMMELWSDAPSTSVMHVRPGTADELNPLLRREHYLGPLDSGQFILVGVIAGSVVAGQVWKLPTTRHLPFDGSWLELARWVLTPQAGENAGTRFHAAAVRALRQRSSEATTLVSYSDPSVGHTGALYRACNWLWAPTWIRLRPPPSGHGAWKVGEPQAIKDRWVFPLRKDPKLAEICAVKDDSAIRFWLTHSTANERARAVRSSAPDLANAARAYSSTERKES